MERAVLLLDADNLVNEFASKMLKLEQNMGLSWNF